MASKKVRSFPKGASMVEVQVEGRWMCLMPDVGALESGITALWPLFAWSFQKAV